MRYIVLALLLICSGVSAAPPKAVILDDGPSVADLRSLYRQAGYSVALVKEADLANLRAPDVSIFVVPPEAVFPPNGRRHLHRYLTEGGNLVVLSPRAFDYMPRPVDPIPVVDFSREDGYTISRPDTASSEVIDIPADRRAGIRLCSEFMARGDLSVSISLAQHRSADRDMVCVKAKGDYDIDVLMLTLEDEGGAKYVAFTDLTRGWKDYAIPMADFAPVSEDADAPSIDPSKAKMLTVSASTRVVWKGAKGYLAVGPVSLAKSSRYPGVTTSEALKWRAACIRTNAVFRDWAIDPFLDTRRLVNQSPIKVVERQPVFSGDAGHVTSAWLVPGFPAYRAFEYGKVEDIIKLTESRRIPFLQATENGVPVTVAEVRTFSDGPYRTASMVLIGIEGGDYAPGARLGKMLIAASDYVVRTPRILKTTAMTTPSDVSPTRLLCRLTILNPLPAQTVGRVDAGFSRLRDSRTVVLQPRELTEVTLDLGEMTGDRYEPWDARLTAAGREDVIGDYQSAERALIRAAKYALELQKRHRDGRFSHYFFSDIYTARMLVLFSYYMRNGNVSEFNRDLLVGLTPDDFADAGFRFCDMIASKQTPEGAIPIGYSDHRGDMFTADDGTIVMGMLQIASWLGMNDPRSKRYMDVGRKYFAFRESMYITPEKSERLREQYGRGAKGTDAGFYGVGILSTDLFTEGQEVWPSLAVEERGFQWVLPVSMGAVAGLRLLDQSNPDYAEVVLRDAAEIVEKDYPVSKSSHFHFECLYPMIRAVPSAELRDKLIGRAERLIPLMLDNHDGLLHYFEGRGALNWLNLMQYQRDIGYDSRVEALKRVGVWNLCSESSNYSIRSMIEQFPMTTFGPPIGAYRCISNAAMFLMEWHVPEITMLKGWY